MTESATPAPAPEGGPPPEAAPAPEGAFGPATPRAAAAAPQAPPSQPLMPAARSTAAARGAGSVLLAVAALVAVGGVTFAVGRLTAPSAAATTRRTGAGGFGNGNVPGGQGGRQGTLGGLFATGGLTIRGTVTATTPSAITVRLANGNTVEIPTDASTTYHRQAAASSGDITSGSQVLVELGGGGAGTQGPGGQGANPSPSPGASPRFGPARDVTILAP